MRDKTMKEMLASNIKEFCESSKYSHQSIADRLGINPRQLTRYKNGECEPSATTLHDMAKLFNIDMERFFMTFGEWLDHIQDIQRYT